MVKDGLSAPLHEGAAKYDRERLNQEAAVVVRERDEEVARRRDAHGVGGGRGQEPGPSSAAVKPVRIGGQGERKDDGDRARRLPELQELVAKSDGRAETGRDCRRRLFHRLLVGRCSAWHALLLRSTCRLRYFNHDRARANPWRSCCSSRSSPGGFVHRRRATRVARRPASALAAAFAAAYLMPSMRRSRCVRQPNRTDIVTASVAWCCCSRRRGAPSAGRWQVPGDPVHRLRDDAAVAARAARAQGRLAVAAAVAPVADDRGVFGIALASTARSSYVLFGTLLDRAGGGNGHHARSASPRSAICAAVREGQRA